MSRAQAPLPAIAVPASRCAPVPALPTSTLQLALIVERQLKAAARPT